MDPVTIGAVLLAVAGGAGGALGTQVWAGACVLVRRQFRRAHAADTAVAVPSGQAELAALEHAPTDHQRAVALAEVLLARADGDAGFAAALAAWWAQASQIEAGQVTSTITSGTFHGPVLQGRDFTGLTLTTPPPAPPALDPGA